MHSANDTPSIPLIHVVIVEDDPGFRESLCHVIEAAPDMRLAGTAGTRAEGLALLEGPPADVLLVDLGLPDGSGIDIIRVAMAQWPSCNIMVSTNFGDETHVMRSIEAGAAGYLLKDSSPTKTINEIRSIASGGSPISPIIARQILARLRPPGASTAEVSLQTQAQIAAHNPAHIPDSSPLLSSREKEVLDFISKGFTMPEIADLMQLSHFTVRTFVRRIYKKLNVTSKTEAIYEARSLKLLDN